LHPKLLELIDILDSELAGVGDPMSTWHTTGRRCGAATPQEYDGILGLNLEEKSLPTSEEFRGLLPRAPPRSSATILIKFLARFRDARIFRGPGERAVAGIPTAAKADVQGAVGHVGHESPLNKAAHTSYGSEPSTNRNV
jgi:hypothetical protein